MGTVLIEDATEDTTSSTISATGPIILGVVGVLGGATVRVGASLGSGEVTVFRCTAGDPIKMDRIEMAEGMTFTAYLEGATDDTEVTVEYIYV